MRKLQLYSVFALLLLFSGLAISRQEPRESKKTASKTIPDFDVSGISFTECQCTAYACPCRSNGHPNHGSSDATDFVYFTHGHYGNVDMSGFKGVVVSDLIDTDASKVHGFAYFDKASTPAQQDAFKQMLAFLFGWNRRISLGPRLCPLFFANRPAGTRTGAPLLRSWKKKA
jgi:hypothetical protein